MSLKLDPFENNGLLHQKRIVYVNNLGSTIGRVSTFYNGDINKSTPPRSANGRFSAGQRTAVSRRQTWPASNFFRPLSLLWDMLATTAEAQAIAPLQSTSPCKGAGTDGKDLGANVPGVNALVAKGKIA